MNNKIKKALLIVLLILFNISSIILLSKLFYLDKVKPIMLLIVELLITYILIRKNTKPKTKIILSIICIILTCFYTIIDYSIYHSKQVIKEVTTIKGEYKVYNVLVLKNSKYKDIKELKNKNIGFIDSDILLEDSINILSKRINFETKKYQSIDNIISLLNNKEIDAFSIEDSMISALEEAEIDIKNNTKVIYEYKVKIKEKEVIKADNNTTKPFILYISGTDSRTGINTVSRSDVNIVTVIDPEKRKILLVSIPRDYYVQLHDTTGLKDKLTHAGIYGINKSISTIEDLLDINIDRYVKVSFSTVKETVNLIDGIDIYSEIDFTSWTNRGCKFHTGMQHVNGHCALAFARERRAYTRGDRHRGENQEQVIMKVLEKITEPKYLLKYNQLLEVTRNTLQTNMTDSEIISFVEQEYHATTKWQVETYNLDGEGTMLPTYSMGSMNLWVMIPNEETIITAKEKINEYLNME